MAKATTEIDIRDLLKAGAHFGHKPNHWNPKMKPYIHSKREGIYIIDLIKTQAKLKTALAFLEETAAANKQVLFVGTKRHIHDIVKKAAEAAGMPYVIEHWYGGMLTNFETFHGQIKRLNKLEEQKASGELAETLSKRDLGETEEEIAKLNTAFGGIKEVNSLPGALFVADAATERTAVREAKRLGIPVVAIVDTNADPTMVDYVIPANDDAVRAVTLICNAASEAVVAGVAKRKAPKEEQPKTDKKPAKE